MTLISSQEYSTPGLSITIPTNLGAPGQHGRIAVSVAWLGWTGTQGGDRQLLTVSFAGHPLARDARARGGDRAFDAEIFSADLADCGTGDLVLTWSSPGGAQGTGVEALVSIYNLGAATAGLSGVFATTASLASVSANLSGAGVKIAVHDILSLSDAAVFSGFTQTNKQLASLITYMAGAKEFAGADTSAVATTTGANAFRALAAVSYIYGGSPPPPPPPPPPAEETQSLLVTLNGESADLYASTDGGQTKVRVRVTELKVDYATELYVIGGQSNAMGKGLLSEVTVFPRLGKMYSNAAQWVTATEPTDSSVGQVDAVSDDGAQPGASFGTAFIDRMSELKPGTEIGVIPCAKGSSPLEQWARDLSRATLYGSMLARMQEASAFGKVKAVLWYQGESDAVTQARAESWAANFLQMANDLTADFGDPDLRFIVVELGPPDSPPDPYWETVKAQQRSVDGALNGRVGVVTASDLADRIDDPVHLTTASQNILGQRMAEKLVSP